MTQFHLRINTDNAAFADGDHGPELARTNIASRPHLAKMMRFRMSKLTLSAALRVSVAPAILAVAMIPGAAFAQAVACAEPADRIVVFGSFFTVGGVLAHGAPRMQGRHATHPSP